MTEDGKYRGLELDCFLKIYAGKAKLRENRQNWLVLFRTNKIGKLTYRYLQTNINTGSATEF
jgi:hypothetical protein